MSEIIDQALDWDAEVSEEMAGNTERKSDPLVVLPPGNYQFKVHKVERGTFNGSAKLPACNMVKVGIIVDGGELGHSYVTTRFYMHTRCLWQIFQFLTALGLRKSGDGTSRIPWEKVVPDLEGKCHVKIHTYNDKESNEVDRWIESVSEAAQDEEY